MAVCKTKHGILHSCTWIQRQRLSVLHSHGSRLLTLTYIQRYRLIKPCLEDSAGQLLMIGPASGVGGVSVSCGCGERQQSGMFLYIFIDILSQVFLMSGKSEKLQLLFLRFFTCQNRCLGCLIKIHKTFIASLFLVTNYTFLSSAR